MSYNNIQFSLSLPTPDMGTDDTEKHSKDYRKTCFDMVAPVSIGIFF